MRILLVAPFFPPQRAVAALRTHSFARVWAAAGHDVTVLTTAKRDDQRGQPLPTDHVDVVEIPYRGPWLFEKLRGSDRATTGEVASPSLIKRVLRGLKRRTGIFSGVRQPDLTDSWIKPALDWARTPPAWDVVVSSGGPPAAHLVGMRVKQAGRATRFAADFRDLWTDNHLYSGLFPYSVLERRRERHVLREADVIVSVSSALAARLSEKSGKPAEIVFNGFDPTAAVEGRPAFPVDGCVRLVYTGTVYEQGQDVRPLCDAVAKEPSAILVVASDRGDVWEAARRRFGLGDRLDFRGSVTRPEALRLQRDASALVLLDWKRAKDGVLTGKLFEYLNATAPIWLIGGPDDSPAKELVERAGRGFAFGSDVEAIRRAIRRPTTPAADRGFISSLGRQEQALRFLSLLGAGGPTTPTTPPRPSVGPGR